MSTPGPGPEGSSGMPEEWFQGGDAPEAGASSADSPAAAAPGDSAASTASGPSGLPSELSPRGSGGRRSAALAAAGSGSGGGKSGGRGIGMKIAAVASAFIVLGSATGYAVTQKYLGEVNQFDAFKGITDRPEKVDVPAQNILVAGVDDRSDLTAAEKKKFHVGSDDYGKRSDTMMLLHISDKQKTITAISFPRDSLVTIPAYTDDAGKKHPAQKQKLNAAYAFGGEKLTIETIEKATGVRIDHYLEVDLGGFVRMINAVGGVDVCVTSAVKDTDSGLNLPKGKSHLNGVQGLAFVRARHIYADQDLGRIRAQQKFIGAMINRATSKGVLLDPIKLNKFLSAATKSLHTDMSDDQIVDLAKQMRDYKPADISFQTVPIGNSNGTEPGVGSVVTWNKTQSRELFANLKNDIPVTEKKAAKLTVAPGSIKLQVLNGAGVQGLGSQAADALANRGFGMAGIAKNADVTDQKATVVRYDPKYVEASKTVLASIPGSTAVAVPGLGKTLEVVVGSEWEGANAVKVTTATTTAKPKPRTAADDVCK